MTTPGSESAPQPSIELLWFQDCPNYLTARQMLIDLMTTIVPRAVIVSIDATDPSVAASLRFPGSPTIRVDGIDVDPSYSDPGDYTPRCRLYRTAAGLRGLPDTEWIRSALEHAVARRARG